MHSKKHKKIDLNSIEIFIEVAKNLNFTKSAALLEMEVSKVSTKIKELENSLGIKLFSRSTRKVNLTEAGSEYLEYCIKGLNLISQGQHLIIDKEKQISGTLRISVPINSLELMMGSLIGQFLIKYPKVNIEIIQSQNLPDMIGGNFNFSIISKSNSLKDSSLIAKLLIKTPSLLVASDKYLNKNSFEDFSTLEMIGFCDLDGKNEEQQKIYLKNQVVNANFRLKSNGIHGVLMGIKNSLGIGIIPKILIIDELESGELQIVTDEVTLSDTNLYLVYPTKEGMTAVEQAFIDEATKWGDLSQKKLAKH